MPITARRQATRDRLLDAAEEVFAEHGYAGASVDDVAAAAGFTKGAVYSNFNTKDELLAALMTRRSERNLAAIEALLAHADTPASVYTALDTWFNSDPDAGRQWSMLELELALAAARNPALGELLARHHAAFRAHIAEIVHRVTAHAVPADSELAATVARTILAIGDGIALQRLFAPDTPADAYSQALRLLAGGVGIEPRAGA